MHILHNSSLCRCRIPKMQQFKYTLITIMLLYQIQIFTFPSLELLFRHTSENLFRFALSNSLIQIPSFSVYILSLITISSPLRLSVVFFLPLLSRFVVVISFFERYSCLRLSRSAFFFRSNLWLLSSPHSSSLVLFLFSLSPSLFYFIILLQGRTL